MMVLGMESERNFRQIPACSDLEKHVIPNENQSCAKTRYLRGRF